jgi:hypothetical protein
MYFRPFFAGLRIKRLYFRQAFVAVSKTVFQK